MELKGGYIHVVKIKRKKNEGKTYNKEQLVKEYEEYSDEMIDSDKTFAFFVMISNIGKIKGIPLHPDPKCIENFLLGILKNLKDSNGNSFPDETEIVLTAQQFEDEDVFDGEPNEWKIKEGSELKLSLVKTYEKIGFEVMKYEDALLHGMEVSYNKITKKPNWA
jgi:hypothetical protein